MITPCLNGVADSGLLLGSVDVCEGGFVMHCDEIGVIPFAVSVCADCLWLVDGPDVWTCIPNHPSRVLHKDIETAIASMSLYVIYVCSRQVHSVIFM